MIYTYKESIYIEGSRAFIRVPFNVWEETAMHYLLEDGTLRIRFHPAEVFERKGDLYVFGSGESRIAINSSSGNLEIQ